MKTLYTYYDEKLLGEAQAFFNGDKLITIIDGNDGNYRSSYMNCLFESFGVKVVSLKKLNAKQKKVLVAEAQSMGFSNEAE